MGINFQKLGFKYSSKASKTLKDINLSINEKNEFIFIVGKTGSGKTTLVQNMNALLLPTEGSAEIFGINVIKGFKKVVKFNTPNNRLLYEKNAKGPLFKAEKPIYNTSLRKIRQRVGLVFQFPEYQLFEATVLKDVMFGPKNFGYSEEEAKELAVKALRLVGIDSSLFDVSPFELSGGQMRRVSIATILACNPDIIIFDEPTVGLDPVGKLNLVALLHQIQRESGKTIIIVSHDMDFVAENGTRAIVIAGGEIKYDGTPADLFNDTTILNEYALALPSASRLALMLKEKGLIDFNRLPIKQEELINIITGGTSHE